MRLTPEQYAKLPDRMKPVNEQGRPVQRPPSYIANEERVGTMPTAPVFSRLAVSPSKDVADLNRTEAAWLAKMLADTDNAWVGVQNITLKLAADCRYTPDFFAIKRDGTLWAYEVKGFWRDDARVKVKVAARSFPWVRFVAVSKKGKHDWTTEDFAP